MNKFFITTAIDYVNAPPHVGHALEKVQADVIARYHRLLDDEVLFLTGTDENSLKNVKAAKKEGISVQKLVDRNYDKFHKLQEKEVLNLSLNDFIRTTEERHIKGAQKLWSACEAKEDIYKEKYKGLYCVGCEEFYKESELKDGLCPEHEIKPELIEEKNYFFKLSKYQDPLRKIISNDKLKIIPETRKNEVLSFIKSGLEDICISRSSERAEGWGIDVPRDHSQKIWVWFDALSNYINAVGYANDEKKFRKWWSEETKITHIIGKGILRFHAVYWPAFLLSAGLPLPKTIFVHGYLTTEGKKISKSLGNVIDPFELTKKYKTDVVRYFLLREIPATEDGDFNFERLKERNNADLADGLGNLVARTLTMAEKYWKGEIPKIDISKTGLNPFSPARGVLDAHSGKTRPANFRDNIKEKHESISYFLEKTVEPNIALLSINTLIKQCNNYIDLYKLYKPLENTREKINIALYDVLENLRHIAWMLLPFLPNTADKIFTQLGLDLEKEKQEGYVKAKKWGGLEPGTKIRKGKILFPRT